MNASTCPPPYSPASLAQARAAVGVGLGLLIITALTGTISIGVTTGPAIHPDEWHLRLDPNRVTAAELDLLPRIGGKTAENILAYRESADRQPAFTTPEDLDEVPRIGPATIDLLRPYLRFSNPNSQPGADPDAP